jgi:hypothetical protein
MEASLAQKAEIFAERPPFIVPAWFLVLIRVSPLHSRVLFSSGIGSKAYLEGFDS